VSQEFKARVERRLDDDVDVQSIVLHECPMLRQSRRHCSAWVWCRTSRGGSERPKTDCRTSEQVDPDMVKDGLICCEHHVLLSGVSHMRTTVLMHRRNGSRS
jgi:hypothetical protein